MVLSIVLSGRLEKILGSRYCFDLRKVSIGYFSRQTMVILNVYHILDPLVTSLLSSSEQPASKRTEHESGLTNAHICYPLGHQTAQLLHLLTTVVVVQARANTEALLVRVERIRGHSRTVTLQKINLLPRNWWISGNVSNNFSSTQKLARVSEPREGNFCRFQASAAAFELRSCED